MEAVPRASAAQVLGTSEQELERWLVDADAFLKKAVSAPASGLKSACRIWCYFCENEWMVPPWVQLAPRNA